MIHSIYPPRPAVQARTMLICSNVAATGDNMVSSGIPLTEEEAADAAKRHIDEAVAMVAEMQLTEEQLNVRD